MLLLLSFYSHYTGQAALVATLFEHQWILLEQSFIAHMPLQTTSSTLGLERSGVDSLYHVVCKYISIIYTHGHQKMNTR